MSDKTILLVDDDDVFREAVSIILETRYKVQIAKNGTEALLKIEEQIPDLVILDVMMDRLTEGFDVAQKLRASDDTSSIPIIMLTGVDQVYNVRMEVGRVSVPCDRYLEKPVDPSDLLKTVAQLIP